MDQVAIRAIQAMLAPVVLITTAAILSGGIQTMYAAVNDRMRSMTAERLSRLTTSDGEFTSPSALPPSARERLRQIDTELPLLLRRHWMLHNVLMLIYTSVLLVVIAMVLIAVAITGPEPAAGDVALVVMLTATGTLMLGLVLVALTVRHSANAIDYEVQEVLRLGS